MIVTEVKKSKTKSFYTVIIDSSSYLFSEDVLIEYRLIKGREIEKEELEEALEANSLDSFYQKCLKYVLAYGKNEHQAREYLKEKGLDADNVSKIIDKLKTQKFINDDRLIDQIVDTLIRKGNGYYMIEAKLKEKGFSSAQISFSLEKIPNEEYFEALERLYTKTIEKNHMLDSYMKKQKTRQYLLNRGYRMNEIVSVEK